MSSASMFADLCPHTIVFQSMTGRDSFGKPTYATGVHYIGRRVFKKTRVSSGGRDGADVVAESQIWIMSTPNVKYEDAVYVLGDSPPYPPILNIQKFPDENGDYYVKVLLGSANG